MSTNNPFDRRLLEAAEEQAAEEDDADTTTASDAGDGLDDLREDVADIGDEPVAGTDGEEFEPRDPPPSDEPEDGGGDGGGGGRDTGGGGEQLREFEEDAIRQAGADPEEVDQSPEPAPDDTARPDSVGPNELSPEQVDAIQMPARPDAQADEVEIGAGLREQRIAEAQERFGDQFGPEDFRIVLGEGGTRAVPTDRAVADRIAEEQASDLEDFEASDLDVTLSEDAEDTFNVEVRESALRENFAEAHDVDPGDVEIEETDEGFVGRVDPEPEVVEPTRADAARQFQERGDLLASDQAQQLAGETGATINQDVTTILQGVTESDVELDETDEGFQATLTEDVERDLARVTAAEQLGVEESDVELTETESGAFSAGVSEEVIERELAAEEADLETATATVPSWVPGVGGQEVSGQVRDVDLEVDESGEVEVTEQERFGDFDATIPGFVPGIGGQEVEAVTGAAGDRLIEAGETTGGVLREELVEERTVLPGAVVEEALTGDTDFVGSAVEDTPVGLAGIADQALNLPQETAEFGVEGVQAWREGRLGVSVEPDTVPGTAAPTVDVTLEDEGFVPDVADAAVGAGIETGQQAIREPGAFTGQVAGSAVGATGGILAATRFAGPRTGRAVSAAVQPGEELAITAARRGVVSPRTAQFVPGVREGHIGRGDTDVDVDVPDRFDTRLDLEAVRAGAADRLPRVSVERDVDAGFVEIDGTPVSEAAAAAGRRGVQRTRQLPRQAEIAGLRARRQLGERLTDIRFEAAEARARARAAVPSRADLVPEDPLGPVRRRGQRVELAARRGARDVSESVSDIEFIASEAAARTRRAPFVAAERGRIARTRLERDISDFLVDVRFEAEQARARASDAVPAIPESEFLAAEGTGRVDTTRLLPPSERPRVGRPSLPSVGLPESEFLRATGTQRVDPIRAVPDVERPTIPEFDLPESEFLAAEGTGRADVARLLPPSGTTRVSRPTLDLPEIDLPESEFLAAEETARADVVGAIPEVDRPGRPSIPEFDLPSSAFLGAEETGRADPLRIVPDVERPSVPTVRGRVPSPREFTLRIDRRDPTDVDVVDVPDLPDAPDVDDGPAVRDVEAVDEPDGDAAGVGSVGGGLSATRTESGVAVQRVQGEPPVERESIVERGIETEQATRSELDTAQRVEPVVTPEDVGEVDVGMESMVEPVQEVGVGVEPVTESVTEPITEPGVETRLEPRIEPRLEVRTEPIMEPRLETRVEPRPEPVTELDVGLPDFDDPDRRRRQEEFETFEREIIAPIEEDPLADL